jgi:hypothetical protein
MPTAHRRARSVAGLVATGVRAADALAEGGHRRPTIGRCPTLRCPGDGTLLRARHGSSRTTGNESIGPKAVQGSAWGSLAQHRRARYGATRLPERFGSEGAVAVKDKP